MRKGLTVDPVKAGVLPGTHKKSLSTVAEGEG